MVDYSADATRYARGRPKGIAAPDDDAMSRIRRGYTAFNTGDVDTLRTLFAHDVMHHTAGTGPLAGTYKGADAVLEYFGKLNERCEGTFRADLLEVHGDGHGHVTAVHQISATRGGNKLVSRGSILFTFMGEKVTDILELNSDLAGYDAFMS
jgi:ketosteroid isomerase-like protein